jgi:hypothetical protein
MKSTVKFWTFLLTALAVAASPVCADSLAQGDLLFELNLVYVGSATPQGTPPWLTATFQNLGTNSVQLTMNYSGVTSGSTEYVSSWFFNFNPDLDLFALVIDSQPGTVEAIPSYGPDGETAGDNLKFDIKFSFSDTAFTAGNTSVILISSTDLIDASSFDFLSTNNNNPVSTNYYSAANILGIAGGLNSWVAAATAQTPSPGPSPGPSPVPEPATMILLGCGLGGLTILGRKKLST